MAAREPFGGGSTGDGEDEDPDVDTSFGSEPGGRVTEPDADDDGVTDPGYVSPDRDDDDDDDDPRDVLDNGPTFGSEPGGERDTGDSPEDVLDDGPTFGSEPGGEPAEPEEDPEVDTSFGSEPGGVVDEPGDPEDVLDDGPGFGSEPGGAVDDPAPSPDIDFGPDFTVTGQGLEAGGGSQQEFTATVGGQEITGTERDIAQAVERQVLDDAGGRFGEEDIAVVRRGGGLAVDFTDQSRDMFSRRGELVAEQTRERVRRDLEDQTGRRVGPDDFRLVREGDTLTATTTEEFNEELAAEIAAEREAEFLGGYGADLLDQSRNVEQRLEAQIRSQTGRDIDLEEGRDYTVDEDGNVTLTTLGERKARGDEFAERNLDEVPGWLSVAPGIERGDTYLDVQQGIDESVGAYSRQVDRVVEGGGALAALDRGLLGYYASSQGPLPEGDRDLLFTNAEPGGLEDVDVDEDAPATEQAESALRGALLLPASATGLVSAGFDVRETALEAGSRLDTERVETTTPGPGPGRTVTETRVTGAGEAFDVVAGEAAEAGEGIVTETAEAVRSPTGRAELAGGLVTSALLFGGASAIGPRASAAARYTIQPGEELAGIGLNRGLRTAGSATGRPGAGVRAAETLAPNNELLLFSEEAAIAGARGLYRRGSEGVSNVRRLSRGEFEAADVPSVNVERFERLRPGGPTSVLGEETVQAAPTSGPLGSTTEFRPSRFRAEDGGAERGAEFGGGSFRPSDELGWRIQELGERADYEMRLPRDPGTRRVLGETEAEYARRLRREREEEVGDAADAFRGLQTAGGERVLFRDLAESPSARVTFDTEVRTGRPVEREPSDLPSEPPTELGDVDRASDLFGEGEAEEGDPGALTRAERERLEASRRRFFEAEEETVGRSEVPRVESADLDLFLGPELGFRPLLDTGASTDLRTGAETEVDRRQDFGLDQEFRLDTEQEQEAEAETELETEQELERELERELELETELETETETETETERRREEEDRRRRRREPGFGLGGARADAGDSVATGFLGETFAGFAGFGIAGAGDAGPTRAELEEAEELSPFGENVAGELEVAVAEGVEGVFGEGAAQDFGFGDTGDFEL